MIGEKMLPYIAEKCDKGRGDDDIQCVVRCRCLSVFNVLPGAKILMIEASLMLFLLACSSLSETKTTLILRWESRSTSNTKKIRIFI